ncbi:hypothetical protein Bbelb_264740 [Branchiostoma belcheri]|nr:hypothetical protein Bbelb_264740 [Branchiostoma belcheri]
MNIPVKQPGPTQDQVLFYYSPNTTAGPYSGVCLSNTVLVRRGRSDTHNSESDTCSPGLFAHVSIKDRETIISAVTSAWLQIRLQATSMFVDGILSCICYNNLADGNGVASVPGFALVTRAEYFAHMSAEIPNGQDGGEVCPVRHASPRKLNLARA